MKEFDESKHPRADDGKFTDGNNSGKTQWITSKRDYSNVQGIDKKVLQSDDGNDKITKEHGFINIQLFAAPRLIDQTPQELEKSIKSFKQIVLIHEDKVAHPEQYVSNWGKRSEQYRMGIIKKWEKEILNHKNLIEKGEYLLEQKGENDGK